MAESGSVITQMMNTTLTFQLLYPLRLVKKSEPLLQVYNHNVKFHVMCYEFFVTTDDVF